MLTIKGAIREAAHRLQAAGVEDARRDATLLLGHVRGRDRAALLADAFETLDAEERSIFQNLIERRARREPLAQIVGRKEFWSLDLHITADVLCPRPDSECLIEAARDLIGRRQDERNVESILDLGTGSGCLLLALLSEWPAAQGIGVDLSRPALAIARSNAESLGFAERTTWVCANWGDALRGGFDLIVSNPPYIREGDATDLAPEIRVFEPELALFGGPDGLDAYRSLAGELGRLLAPDGLACLEIGFDQASSVEALLKEAGLNVIGCRQDLAGRDRCLIVEQA